LQNLLREVCALGFAGGDLLFEVGVKNQKLFEAQPSFFDLANKN
jgi:hypothetical protein